MHAAPPYARELPSSSGATTNPSRTTAVNKNGTIGSTAQHQTSSTHAHHKHKHSSSKSGSLDQDQDRIKTQMSPLKQPI